MLDLYCDLNLYTNIFFKIYDAALLCWSKNIVDLDLCSANQWTDFYMIKAPVMKELNTLIMIIRFQLVLNVWKSILKHF